LPNKRWRIPPFIISSSLIVLVTFTIAIFSRGRAILVIITAINIVITRRREVIFCFVFRFSNYSLGSLFETLVETVENKTLWTSADPL